METKVTLKSTNARIDGMEQKLDKLLAIVNSAYDTAQPRDTQTDMRNACETLARLHGYANATARAYSAKSGILRIRVDARANGADKTVFAQLFKCYEPIAKYNNGSWFITCDVDILEDIKKRVNAKSSAQHAKANATMNKRAANIAKDARKTIESAARNTEPRPIDYDRYPARVRNMIDAALDAANKHGFDNARVRSSAIADESGAPLVRLYVYCGDKSRNTSKAWINAMPRAWSFDTRSHGHVRNITADISKALAQKLVDESETRKRARNKRRNKRARR